MEPMDMLTFVLGLLGMLGVAFALTMLVLMALILAARLAIAFWNWVDRVLP